MRVAECANAHTCTYTHARTRSHTYTRTYAHTYADVHGHRCTHAYTCTHMHTQEHTYTCTQTCTHRCTHACTHTHAHTCAGTYTHKHMYATEYDSAVQKDGALRRKRPECPGPLARLLTPTPQKAAAPVGGGAGRWMPLAGPGQSLPVAKTQVAVAGLAGHGCPSGPTPLPGTFAWTPQRRQGSP